MSIKLVVSDIDGTLIGHTEDSKYFISKETVQEINKLKDKSIHFLAATGRHYKDAYNILKNEKIEMLSPAYVVGMNGLQIYSVDEDRLLLDEFIDEKYHEAIFKLYQVALKDEPDNLIVILSCENDVVQIVRNSSKKLDEIIEKIMRFENNDQVLKYEIIDDIKDAKKLYKVAFSYSVDIQNGAEKIDLLKSVSTELDYLLTGDGYIEVVPKNINKGSAIKFLKDLYKINRNELIVIGDSGNDLSMFHQSTNSVTRSCARDFVINSVSKTFDGGASVFVGNAIKHYIK